MLNINLDVNALPLETQKEKPMESNIPSELNEIPKTENNKGIEATKAALIFLIALGSAIKVSLEDGTFTVVDALNFYEPAKKLFPFVSKISEIPSELGDVITPEEQAEIVKIIETSGFLQEESETVALEALDVILQLKNFIFKNFINKNA